MDLQQIQQLAAVALLFCCTPASALKTYDTTCTLPPDNATDRFYYVSSPDVRGSMNIVWTCLATLTVCIWNVLHLNVAEQRNGRDPGRWGDFKWLGIWRDLWWALVMAFAPEYALARGVDELILSRKDLHMLQEIPNTNSTWTLTHVFYLNMGGLITIADGKRYMWTSKRIRKAIEIGTLSPIAPITADEIMDKSKSDFFAKFISVCQILYFYIDFFARVVQDLPISQLELGVAAVAFFSLITYACLVCKPRAARTPTRLTLEDFQQPPRFEEIFGLDYDGRYDHVDSLGDDKEETYSRWLFGIGCAVLGAVHLTAWNFEFPSAADMWLWRVAGIVVTAVSFLVVGYALLLQYFELDDGLIVSVHLILIAVYVIARLVLFVEMVRCLFYLPAESFRTTSWAMSIPHFG